MQLVSTARGDGKVELGSGLALHVSDWAALIGAPESRKALGAVAPPSFIPAGQRRRMPSFVLDAALCCLPLLQNAPESDVIYCSCYGDLSITVDLLRDLLTGELLSPAKFSISVHNAPAGMIGLAFGRVGNHTAIAGGAESLAAGLTEAYARLASGETQSVVLVLAEAHLPDVYKEFDEGGPDTFLALSLHLPIADAADTHRVEAGRAGAAAMTDSLERGVRTLRFSPPGLRAAS
jgi:hypothetical protein